MEKTELIVAQPLPEERDALPATEGHDGGVAVASPGARVLRRARPPRADETRPGLLRRVAPWLPLFGFVGLPALGAALYFGVIASDRYVAEAEFVVRSADRAAVTGLGAILQSTGLNPAHDDGFFVQSFLKSRDALAILEEKVGFSEKMGREGIDFVARWPNVLNGDSFEDLYDYFHRRVSVTRDLTSGVSLLRVEAFVPDDAEQIAAALLATGEDFVNDMNDRALADAVALAQAEVALAEQRVADNQIAFAAFRRDQGLVNPSDDSAVQMELLAALGAEISTLESDERRIAAATPNSPQLAPLRRRTAALRRQVEVERAKLAGADGALAEVYGAFESLMLEQRFAQEALLMARAGLEQARSEAIRKQRYLVTVVSPRAPDEAREPRRFFMTLSVAATAFLLYGVGWLLWVNAREHKT